MSNRLFNPTAITEDSFALIRQELAADGYKFEPDKAAIIERIIHSTADFDFAKNTRFSPNAITRGITAIQQGCAIITDVNMIRVGISEKRLSDFGGTLHCLVADEETRKQAIVAETTRSAMGIRRAAKQGLIDGSIIVVGNAPTALYESIKLLNQGFSPALIVGVPVGFVSTVESKEALMKVTSIPWVATAGRKGGSPVAVAVINGLLRLAKGVIATEVEA
ncbi:MAG: precorrin-8X methylmutase [Chloroflexota bacterium]